MADIDKAQEAMGFKLFGTTIAVEMKETKEETLKARRPDKAIQCPRCKSMETKFCYFNNYNVNQPRHFCKGCQRYWTAGGALRNVPIGAGRRKTKPSGHGTIGFSNDGPIKFSSDVFDVSGVVREFGFDGVVEQWHMAASSGGFRHVQVKRRCTGSPGQLC